MREKQLHICHSNTLYGIKVTRIGILVASHQLIKQQSINILRT